MDKLALSAREAEAWVEFRAEVDRLTPEQRERPDATADGWSVRDMLWHVTYWWDDLTRMLGEMREGTFVEPPEDDEATNAENARVLERSRSMTLAEVEEGLDRARGRMLAAWEDLPELGEQAEQQFVWETIEHYEEHLPELQRFAERVVSG